MSRTVLREILTELRLIRIAVERIQPEVETLSPEIQFLFSEIQRATNGARFTVTSLMEKAELLADDGDESLQAAIVSVCDGNGVKLGKLFSIHEGNGIKRIRNGRDGIVWQLKK